MTVIRRLRSVLCALGGPLGMAVALLFALGDAGCAFHVVQTPPLTVRSLETGELHVVEYPSYVLVHDAESDWDVHQIKNNVIGLFDGELLGWVDHLVSQGLPERDGRPLLRGIEWIKNSYAQAPDIAPVRIVGGFFSAFGIEKTSVLGGVRIAGAPGDPISYFAFLRVIYLTDWLLETVGEANTGLGHLIPWEGAFFPAFVTTPVNDAVDWAQFAAVTGYVYVFRELGIGLDNFLYGAEWAWGALVSLFVGDAEPVDQSTSQAGPDKP